MLRLSAALCCTDTPTPASFACCITAVPAAKAATLYVKKMMQHCLVMLPFDVVSCRFLIDPNLADLGHCSVSTM